MKIFVSLLTMLLLCAISMIAEEPKYNEESPLPEGWPAPGPFNKVTEKTYPQYRAAFANGGSQNVSFWRLFAHIKANDIPMTAPVEMEMKPNGGTLSMKSMAFLYQNQKVGETGKNLSLVEVKDLPSIKVLSYAFQGPQDDTNVKHALGKIQEVLAREEKQVETYRLLGYNGPGVPDSEKTWELQAILK